jgi:hypothetical protein
MVVLNTAPSPHNRWPASPLGCQARCSEITATSSTASSSA